MENHEKLNQAQKFMKTATGMNAVARFGKELSVVFSNMNSVENGLYMVKTYFHNKLDSGDEFYIMQYGVDKRRWNNFKMNKGFLRWIGIKPEFRFIDSTDVVTVESQYIHSVEEDQFLNEVKEINDAAMKIDGSDSKYKKYLVQSYPNFQRVMPDDYISLHENNKKEPKVEFQSHKAIPPKPKDPNS